MSELEKQKAEKKREIEGTIRKLESQIAEYMHLFNEGPSETWTEPKPTGMTLGGHPVVEELPALDYERIYNYKKKNGLDNYICNKCGDLISWDLRPERVHPLHVAGDGKIKGDGDCPKYSGGG